MNYISYLNFRLSKLSNYNLLLIYLCFLIIISIPLSIYSDLYLEKIPGQIDINNNLILKSLPFDYGYLLNSLYENGQY